MRTMLLLFTVTWAQSALAQLARPPIRGVAHIAFYVSDLAKTRAFWTDFLGFEECFTLKRPGSEEIQISFIKINDTQYIELFTEKPRAGEMLNHISFYTDDADTLRDYLEQSHIAVPKKVGKGRTGNKNFNIADPDGNTVEMVEYQPDSWTAREKGNYVPDTRISDHIAHVGASVGRLKTGLDFYAGVLGFQEFWRGTGSETLAWVNMRVPDGQDYFEFMLYDTLPEPAKRGTRNHVSLTVPDAEKAIAILKSRPAFLAYSKPLAIQTGRNRKRQVNLYDPDGSRVELMEPNTVDGKPAPSSAAPPPRPE